MLATHAAWFVAPRQAPLAVSIWLSHDGTESMAGKGP